MGLLHVLPQGLCMLLLPSLMVFPHPSLPGITGPRRWERPSRSLHTCSDVTGAAASWVGRGGAFSPSCSPHPLPGWLQILDWGADCDPAPPTWSGQLQGPCPRPGLPSCSLRPSFSAPQDGAVPSGTPRPRPECTTPAGHLRPPAWGSCGHPAGRMGRPRARWGSGWPRRLPWALGA